MKNILENQCIKIDKPLPMSYEALKAERDALAQRVEMLSQNLGNAIWGEQEALQRVNALAVENASFKHALSVILEHVDVTDKGQAGVVVMIANDELFNSETPATDAALAAIQAQGVEKFAAQQEQLAADYRKLSPGCYGETSSAENALMARDFAAKLREGK
ncbi:hypothetical protein JY494_26725 [Serratia marcescens]|nr:hypothetical protein [Serratia marcescens]